MSTLLSPGIGEAEAEAEANWLCPLIEAHAEDLTAARLGQTFRLGDACLRLYAQDRNTIYRVSGRFDWFLKLFRAGNAGLLARERLGAEIIGAVLGNKAEYGGARVIRVATDPSYVLAATIPGTPLNRVLVTESWLPGSDAAERLEASFATLGTLLATLHAVARVPPNAPAVTKRPFEALGKRLHESIARDAVTETIAAWYPTYSPPDHGGTFVHGNMRLDNVLRVDSRVGFIDFEHCGQGSLYQDLSRPVTQLLQMGALIAFPRRRAARCVNAFLREYRAIQSYDTQQLNGYVSVRLARYYLEIRNRGFLPGRIGGLPVVTSKLGRLTTAVLRDGIESIIPGSSG